MNPEHLIFFGFFAVVLGLIWFGTVLAKRRTQAVADLAPRLGLNFSPTSDVFQRRQQSFRLFQRGRKQETCNVMAGTKEGCQVEVLEFKYVSGSGKNKSTRKHTVIAVVDSRCSFPHFTLQPENIFHKIGTAFGMQDIDFEEYPEFSKTFLLQGEPESAVRSVFTPDIVRILLERKQLCIEASGDTMLFYLSNKGVLPIDEIEAALIDCLILKSVFSRR